MLADQQIGVSARNQGKEKDCICRPVHLEGISREQDDRYRRIFTDEADKLILVVFCQADFLQKGSSRHRAGRRAV